MPRRSIAWNGTAMAETMSGSARRKRSSVRTSLANSGPPASCAAATNPSSGASDAIAWVHPRWACSQKRPPASA